MCSLSRRLEKDRYNLHFWTHCLLLACSWHPLCKRGSPGYLTGRVGMDCTAGARWWKLADEKLPLYVVWREFSYLPTCPCLYVHVGTTNELSVPTVCTNKKRWWLCLQVQLYVWSQVLVRDLAECLVLKGSASVLLLVMGLWSHLKDSLDIMFVQSVEDDRIYSIINVLF